MFSSRTALSLYLPRVLYDCSRNVRMGVSIPVKKVKPVLKPKKKENYNMQELEKERRHNKGIAHGLLRRVGQDGYDVNEHEDPEDLLSSDFDGFDSAHVIEENRKFLEKDMKTKHFHNIKRKYFKEENLPNMVTYLEKQQIKSLHKEDPEHWNIYELAKSFPASPNIIKKIVQSKFTAYTVENVQKHDRTVRKNWDLFRKGKLSFDKELEAHFAKFADRQNFETNVNEIKKYLPPPPDFNDQPIREFSNIIASSKKYKMLRDEERRKAEIDQNGNIIRTAKNMKVKVINEENLFSPHQKSHVTLEQLRKKIESRGETPVDALIKERDPKKSLPLPAEVEESSDNFKKSDYTNNGLEAVDSETSEVKEFEYVNPKAGSFNRRKQKLTAPPRTPEIEEPTDIYQEFDYLHKETGVVGEKLPYNFADDQMDNVRLRIRIPRKLWQKDKVYQIRDCFYDDQGIFLYRVPGLF